MSEELAILGSARILRALPNFYERIASGQVAR
jgi:hypothetical protein